MFEAKYKLGVDIETIRKNLVDSYNLRVQNPLVLKINLQRKQLQAQEAQNQNLEQENIQLQQEIEDLKKQLDKQNQEKIKKKILII